MTDQPVTGASPDVARLRTLMATWRGFVDPKPFGRETTTVRRERNAPTNLRPRSPLPSGPNSLNAVRTAIRGHGARRAVSALPAQTRRITPIERASSTNCGRPLPSGPHPRRTFVQNVAGVWTTKHGHVFVPRRRISHDPTSMSALSG